MSSGTSQQFCVRWNSHLGSLGAAFPQLLAGQRFVDVTLACEGHQLHCHRLVLAACSTYFESLLGENPCKHPIIILPRDIKLWEIQALVDFMYKGEVNVSQAGLSDLLKCAEILQIRGLCGSDAALNLNQVNSNIAQQSTPSSPSSSSSSSSSSSCLSAAAASATNASTSSSHLSTSVTSSTTTQLTADLLTSQQSSNANNERLGDDVQTAPINSCVDVMKTRKSSSSNESNNIRRTTTTSTYGRNDDSSSSSSSLLLTNVKREATDANGSQNLENRIIDKLEPTDGLMDIEVDHPDLSQSTDKTSDESFSTKYVEYLESGKGEFPLANVICEYDNSGLQTGNDSIQGRRIRRSEALLRQAAEFVSRGQTFQTVSDMFGIPISTIRFFMARKGILPRRKRGRSAAITLTPSTQQHSTSLSSTLNEDCGVSTGGNQRSIESKSTSSRSLSPTEPPFHFASYKLPELKPKLL